MTNRVCSVGYVVQFVSYLLGGFSLAKLIILASFNIGWILRYGRILVSTSDAEIVCSLLLAGASYIGFRSADALRPPHDRMYS